MRKKKNGSRELGIEIAIQALRKVIGLSENVINCGVCGGESFRDDTAIVHDANCPHEDAVEALRLLGVK